MENHDLDNAAGPLWDATRVNVNDGHEIRRWCQRLICTEAMLRAAVARVGEDPEAVRAHLVWADQQVPSKRTRT